MKILGGLDSERAFILSIQAPNCKAHGLDMKKHVPRLLMFLGAVAVLSAGLFASGLSNPVEANTPAPTEADTARLLGYMWADGSFSDGVWDLTGPSGAKDLIAELVERHGGEWIDRQELQFRPVAPYDWDNWTDGLPDDSPAVRAAVENPHFLAALLEGESAVDGLVYDQSRCCTDGFTQGRLTELHALLERRGFESAELIQFNNIDSGAVRLDESDFVELRATHEFVCTVRQSDIRIPGGDDYRAFGDLQWLGTDQWSNVVRTDCVDGQAITRAVAPTGTCTATANGDEVQISWTFEIGDVSLRRDGKFLGFVAANEGGTIDFPADGQHRYDVVVRVYRDTATADCGAATAGGNAEATPPPVVNNGACVVAQDGGSVALAWDDFDVSTYQVRRDNRWVQAARNTLSATAPGSVDDTWEIRYRVAGEVIDIACSADGGAGAAAPGPCVVSSVAGGVLVDWQAIDGVSTYQVRPDGRWVAAVRDGTQFVVSRGTLDSEYVIRYRDNGRVIDIPCANI